MKLATSGVNPSDVKARSGATRKIAFPRVIPHSDGAGEIDMVGDGVPAARIGERVWVWNAQWMRAFGTCAEYVTLASAQAVRLPANTDFDAGACFGIPAMTASMRRGVGRRARRDASHRRRSGRRRPLRHTVRQGCGATVITTLSSPEKAKVAREAGADHTIDYKREDVGERVMAITGNKGVDAIIEVDIAANAKLIAKVLRPRGLVVVYGTGSPRSKCRYVLLAQRDHAEIYLCL